MSGATKDEMIEFLDTELQSYRIEYHFLLKEYDSIIAENKSLKEEILVLNKQVKLLEYCLKECNE